MKSRIRKRIRSKIKSRSRTDVAASPFSYS